MDGFLAGPAAAGKCPLSQRAGASAINAAVETARLEEILRDLPRRGTLVADAGTRQTWRFELEGRPYYLYFHPLRSRLDRLMRAVRGSRAMGEFARLQWLQKASVPAPRPVAALLGMRIGGVRGDAVIVEGLEPAQRLDRLLDSRRCHRDFPRERYGLTRQLCEALVAMGRAGLGHSALGLDSFLVRCGRLYLLDARGLHRRGMRMAELERLAVGAGRHAGRSDMLRVWRALGLPGVPPPAGRRHARLWRRLDAEAVRHGRHLARMSVGAWGGWCFRRTDLPQAWSDASRLDIPEADWHRVAAEILAGIEADTLEIIKRSSSGDVLAATVVLAGRPVEVVVKRPRRKFWYRYFTEIWRGTRARRAWYRAWQLIARGIPTAWPLLMLEKRLCGYVTDGLIVSERIPGRPLSDVDHWRQDPQRYHELLRRCGRMLRLMERTGLYFYDSKTTNWMVREDVDPWPLPMLVDVESVRVLNQGGGVRRLLRSLRESADGGFEPADGAALLRGYFPFASDGQIERMLDDAGRSRRRRIVVPPREARA